MICLWELGEKGKDEGKGKGVGRVGGEVGTKNLL